MKPKIPTWALPNLYRSPRNVEKKEIVNKCGIEDQYSQYVKDVKTLWDMYEPEKFETVRIALMKPMCTFVSENADIHFFEVVGKSQAHSRIPVFILPGIKL